ncbi:hypothetical protein GCM10023219_10310 [Stakelama sediminis]|uniref:Cytochrome c oxidase subunit 2 n=1 Tax=Stakelama sediminis TaxID=463200 RepID=A0A840YW34_9SPHN|nr:cytochrome c oxidase subunit II [Stakelama sediminis]MBB5717754.1 cytochrome c oxidase subunit 2 [Stakelama sediminis]
MQLFRLKPVLLAVALSIMGVGAAAAQPATQTTPAASAAATTTATAATPADPTLTADGQEIIHATPGIGQPTARAVDLQPQVTPTGIEAHGFNNNILLPLAIGISVLVFVLLAVAIFRFRAGRNPVPSKTSHNTVLEVAWTVIPVLILVFIAIPSIRLLAHQYRPAPDNAVTLKAIGNQWYWSYEYPDNGDIQFTSNILKEKDEVQPGQRYRTDADGPRLLAVDNRVVLPVGVPIRLLTTSTDVIHSWAVPAFWIKLDAIPGRLNETSFTIEKPGLYFGQCSELCGARHGFMPIAVEAVPPAEFAQWVHAKGGKMPGENAPPPPGENDTDTPLGHDGVLPPAKDMTQGIANGNADATDQPAVGAID